MPYFYTSTETVLNTFEIHFHPLPLLLLLVPRWIQYIKMMDYCKCQSKASSNVSPTTPPVVTPGWLGDSCSEMENLYLVVASRTQFNAN